MCGNQESISAQDKREGEEGYCCLQFGFVYPLTVFEEKQPSALDIRIDVYTSVSVVGKSVGDIAIDCL